MSVLANRSAAALTGWALRLALFLFAFGLGLVAFRLGAEVSQRAGIPDAGLPTQVYNSLALFVMAGVDLGVPSGGPPLAVDMLWVAYFLAPAVTTGAVIEGLLRAMRPDGWEHLGMRGHVVLVGAGRFGVLAADAVRAARPNTALLAVDRSDTSAGLPGGVRFRLCDATRAEVRGRLGLRHARGVLLFTDNDLTNLDLAAVIREEYPNLAGRVVVQVGDLDLLRTLQERLPGMAPTLVNLHRLAVRSLVANVLREHFRATTPQDTVVLAGFGKFGQTVLEALQEDAAEDIDRVIIVDRQAARLVRQFGDEVGFRDSIVREVVEADFADPVAWDPVLESCQRRLAAPVMIIGSHDDELNLRTALWLRRRRPDARVVVRTFRETTLTRSLGAEAGFEVFGLSDLIRRALEQQVPLWFG